MSGCNKKKFPAAKDVVLLHQLDRGIFTPSISPFPLKLETYMRMAGISYENDFKNPMGPKGKTPWMTFNGNDYCDSQLCLELLASKFQKDFSSDLTAEERAIARSFQIMTEEHLYWVLVLWRWVYTKGKTLWDVQMNLPTGLRLVMPLAVRRIKAQASAQGLGRHSKDDVIEMGRKDLRAISDYLGTKPYFTGDKPTEMDCAMFGCLAQLVWSMQGSPYEEQMKGEFANLKEFCERMKEKFWPDWDQCLSPPRLNVS
ncbi:hypothetical protein DAPPUDRAFT_192692 [Daphnia pulex]|uniref:Uncharacterized protein n=1 Tax=Daphnia pulex TaxID=6669 RepID=E9FZN9_DAPPU|nr:hypothetical protein DAPPUDRAFT_192692 [Daphnia pulex]|eukprot:EFX87090.1 hypothetical protein DAPPUDRAFT_192692 [Daphnia pulex]